jgi:putative redox protein
MKVKLRRIEGARFEAVDEQGHGIDIDGPAEVGGRGEGVRPMHLVLMGLAGCSAMDVLLILNKQRQPIEGLEVHVEAERAKTVPAVFTDILLRFEARGPINESKLQRAVNLSVEKYCSVAKMLASSATIRFEAVLL